VNHPWQQPIRPLEVCPTGVDQWLPVLFVRPNAARGWEVITTSGNRWANDNAMIRHAHID
jgi:hypothetical protein